MNDFNHLNPSFIRHPGIREMYEHLQAMEVDSPGFYPPGTADRYLAVTQKTWQRLAMDQNDQEPGVLFALSEEILISA
jgi:hypothetical protein